MSTDKLENFRGHQTEIVQCREPISNLEILLLHSFLHNESFSLFYSAHDGGNCFIRPRNQISADNDEANFTHKLPVTKNLLIGLSRFSLEFCNI